MKVCVTAFLHQALEGAIRGQLMYLLRQVKVGTEWCDPLLIGLF